MMLLFLFGFWFSVLHSSALQVVQFGTCCDTDLLYAPCLFAFERLEARWGLLPWWRSLLFKWFGCLDGRLYLWSSTQE